MSVELSLKVETILSNNLSNRLIFIDVARSYAIILALLAHAFTTTNLYSQLGEESVYIKSLTRTATPMFVFMFGFIIEFIYVNRSKNFGLESIYEKIYIRSFQCYIAYAITSFCALLGGFTQPNEFLFSLIFMDDSRFGNILRAYSILLLLTPAIIKIRLKYGVNSLYAILITLLITYSFIDRFQHIDFYFLNHPLNILFGIGIDKGGPSVLGAFSFYCSGMIIATSFTTSKRHNFYPKALTLVFIMVLAGLLMIPESAGKAWIHFTDFTFRKNNAPGYFIIGTICSLLTLTIIIFLIGTKTPPKAVRYFIPFGTYSLISYTTGNIILNLFGMHLKDANPLIFSAIFLLMVLLIIRNIHRIPYYQNINNFLNFKRKPSTD